MFPRARPTVRLLCFLLTLSICTTLQAQTPDSSKKALSNQDVVDLSKAGLPPEVIMAKIKSSPCDFDTSPSALKILKGAGVSDAVLLFMVQAVPAQPGVDQILDKYVLAIGGEQTVRRFDVYASPNDNSKLGNR